MRGTEGYGLPFPIDVRTREGGNESPHIYILFVYNIIAHFNAVALRSGGALLNGMKCRALQLVDDLAIIDKSAEEQQLLLDAWEKFCDLYHIETQTKKTESNVFCAQDDDAASIIDESFAERIASVRGRRSIRGKIHFTYNCMRIKIVETFTCLGAVFH